MISISRSIRRLSMLQGQTKARVLRSKISSSLMSNRKEGHQDTSSPKANGNPSNRLGNWRKNAVDRKTTANNPDQLNSDSPSCNRS